MPILPNDIQYFLSGGAGNTDPNLSLGGAVSTTRFIGNPGRANLFEDVSESESAQGSTKYRCLYLKNNHATIIMQNTKFFVNTNTQSIDDTISIGIGTSVLNGIEQTIADENTAPIGVVFSAPTTNETGLNLNSILPGETQALWFQRIVSGPVSNTYFGELFVWQVDCHSGLI